MHELCYEHGLRRPRSNTVIEGRGRDCFELTLAGYRVLRFTYEQVTRRPRYVIRALRTALGAP